MFPTTAYKLNDTLPIKYGKLLFDDYKVSSLKHLKTILNYSILVTEITSGTSGRYDLPH